MIHERKDQGIYVTPYKKKMVHVVIPAIGFDMIMRKRIWERKFKKAWGISEACLH